MAPAVLLRAARGLGAARRRRRGRDRRVAGALVGLLALLVGCATAAPASADGPWRGQVVDADTKQPLEGVVVVAAWYLRYASWGGAAGGGYHDSEEVVTGLDGRFVIQARSTATLNPLSVIQGPEWFMFKPGYGHWRVEGIDPAWSWWQRQDRIDEAWKDSTGKGILLEMPRFKTLEERKAYIPGPPSEVPWKRTPRFIEMINRERAFFGWGPVYQGEGPSR